MKKGVRLKMPELPEVETVKRGIAPLLEGNIIVKVIKRRDKIRIPIPKDFEVRCEGQKVLNVLRKAKYILITLESGDVIICHLGMSGRLTLVA
jgi:formamidopyrimidine-DNA glycosylase